VIEYPVFVYRSPGSCRGHLGASYKYQSVENGEEFAAALESGWFRTADEAIAAAGEAAYTHGLNKKQLAKVLKDKPWLRVAPPATFESVPVEPVALDSVPDDNAPPTRAELEEQATLLGIKFDGRTTDKRLADRIAEAMKGA
jgi:hypothetical protein